VHEHDITLAALADLEGLAGADGNNIDIDAVVCLNAGMK